MMLKLQNVSGKRKIFKAAKGKKKPFLIEKQGGLTKDLISDIMQETRLTKYQRRKHHQPRILYPVKLSYKSEGEILS